MSDNLSLAGQIVPYEMAKKTKKTKSKNSKPLNNNKELNIKPVQLETQTMNVYSMPDQSAEYSVIKSKKKKKKKNVQDVVNSSSIAEESTSSITEQKESASQDTAVAAAHKKDKVHKKKRSLAEDTEENAPKLLPLKKKKKKSHKLESNLSTSSDICESSETEHKTNEEDSTAQQPSEEESREQLPSNCDKISEKEDKNCNEDTGSEEQMDIVSKDADIAALEQKTESSLNYDLLTNRSFESLRPHLSALTMQAVDNFGFKELTEIQALALPALLEGKDLRGTAKTGSGKTLAFLIPAIELLQKLKFEPCHGTGVMVLCPTRELSMQTYGVVRTLASPHNLTHGLIIGGANRKAEARNLQKGVNILVGTPGRMLDHLKNTKRFQFGNLVCFILDEADRMLSIGFEEEMKAILRVIPKRRQTMLFSATRTKKTDDLATLALKVTLVDVDVDANKSNATVDLLKQFYLVCTTEQRFLILFTFIKLRKDKKIMVFFSSCDAVKYYHELLNFVDVPVLSIHGKKKQNKRTDTFFEFNAAKSATLLCTDVAARGWDIPEVDWIIQYDPPEDPSEYIHRVGRTARAGKEGQALIFLRDDETPFVNYLKERKVELSRIDVAPRKIFNIQTQLEKLLNKHYLLAVSARKAYKSYLHTYMKHSMKDIFNFHTLDQTKVAKSFGFDRPPVIDLKLNFDKKGSRNIEYKKKRFIKR